MDNSPAKRLVMLPLCVVCNRDAITTAAQIPVCEQHYNEYADEGRKGLPENERVFYKKLLSLA